MCVARDYVDDLVAHAVGRGAADLVAPLWALTEACGAPAGLRLNATREGGPMTILEAFRRFAQTRPPKFGQILADFGRMWPIPAEFRRFRPT